MGVLCYYRKWTSWKSGSEKYQAILANIVMSEKTQRLWFDDHWTFQQENHAKVYIQIYLRLIQGSSLNVIEWPV